MTTIGENIRVLRLARGWTQQQLAEQLHLTRQAVSHYESGRTQPDVDTCRRLAQVFGVELDVLLEGQSAPAAPPRWTLWLPVATAAVFTLIRSVLMLIANLAYPVAQGQIPPEQLDNARIHFALGNAAATVESVNYGVFRLVLLVLVIWALRQKCHVSWRGMARLWLVVVGVSLALSVPFALADPLRGVVDYAYPAFYTAVSAALAAAVVLVVQKLRRRG